MDVIWNQNRMMTLLQSFYTLVKVRVGFFDLEGREILVYPVPRSGYCTMIRINKKGDAACKHCDQIAYQHAAQHQEPYRYQCHAGLIEMIAPIRASEDERIGYLMIGQARQPGNRSGREWEEICRTMGEAAPDRKSLESAYLDLTVLSREQAGSCAHILQSMAAYVWLDGYIRMQKEPVSSRVKGYLAGNLDKILSLERIAKKFAISKTTLCKSLKQDLNTTVNGLIRSLRIERAKELLETSEYLISEIAEKVGIEDYNYFTKVFKAETGVTPSVFRNLCRREYLLRRTEENRRATTGLPQNP
jgi:AraC-like DNA-binding protein